MCGKLFPCKIKPFQLSLVIWITRYYSLNSFEMKTLINLKALAIIAIMAITAFPTFAQGGQRPGGGQRPDGGQRPEGGQWQGRQMTEDDVKERVKRQSQALELTTEQEKKITDFEVEQYKKMQIERQKNQGDWEKMRENMKTQRELRDKKYEEVLTPDQYKKYTQQQEERRQQMEQRRQQNQNGQGGQNREERPERGRGRG